ncbi:venom serine protease-like [Bacillus rossius redtenbacheri]|uniref:venom serine protease-like n=1 Tax=Bacillus rossius redtenbacheri TaxID=93214 RepID=UPI002FDED5A5
MAGLLQDATCALIVTLAAATARISADCDYYQRVTDYASYSIYSPGYPNSYPGDTNCRWYAVAASGSRLYLDCSISIPRMANCTQDRLSVSLTGKTSLDDAEYYCGAGTFSVMSTSNAMNVVLQSSYYSQGGLFFCNLTALPDSATSTTTTTTATPSCSCGWRKTTRIVNGETTGMNEFPMMAGLVELTQRNVFCGATIVARRYVLTAAHCLVKKQTSDVVVLVGEHDIKTGNDTNAARVYQVSRFIAHPGYNTYTQANDFAVIQVAQEIFFSLEVGPACLPWGTTYAFTNDYVEALGWGLLSFGGEAPTALQKVALRVISNSQCYQVFNSTITDSIMCTYTPGKDACQSDSGGPLLWQNPRNGRLFLAGIISVGISCAAEKPAINTRVTSFLSWLAEATPDADYCVAELN